MGRQCLLDVFSRLLFVFFDILSNFMLDSKNTPLDKVFCSCQVEQLCRGERKTLTDEGLSLAQFRVGRFCQLFKFKKIFCRTFVEVQSNISGWISWCNWFSSNFDVRTNWIDLNFCLTSDRFKNLYGRADSRTNCSKFFW